MRVEPTGAFLRNLKKLSRPNVEDTVKALEAFAGGDRGPQLNFEKVKNRTGYFTIRANYSMRILLRQTGDDAFDVVAVGNHDYIYASYFRK